MTLLDLQRALSRILTDSAFRAAFQADPRTTAGGYALDESEFAALTGLPWRRIRVQADALAHNRLGLAFKAFPLAGRLLHDQMHERLDRFCRAHPPTPTRGPAMLAEADRLLAYAAPLLADGRLRPYWAADVLRYEHAMTTLAVSEDAYADAARIAELGRAAVPEDLSGQVVVVGSHAVVRAFDHDVANIVARLEAGTADESLVPAQAPRRILFVRSATGLLVQRYAVNPATACLLDACRGETPVADLLDRLAERLRRPRTLVEPVALAALGRLRGLGVVGLRPANANALLLVDG
jgi:hypothetical protein